jgi:hypothetical protein
LFPPGSTAGLTAIHDVLGLDAQPSWGRPEAFGLLSAAYALLLNASPCARTSPRASGSPRNGSVDVIRKTFRECFRAPSDLKSFTFARLAVIPALQIPDQADTDDFATASASNCDSKEFFLSVLSDFLSQYIDILSTSRDRPLSRARWERQSQDDLRLRQNDQQQQQEFHGQFPGLSDSTFNLGSTRSIETVDLLSRPDCIDDIYGLSIALSSLGPEYSLQFWSQETQTDDSSFREIYSLVPSQAVRDLERQQMEDDSLRATYLSFLAWLSTAQNPFGSGSGADGADLVHTLLSGDAGGASEIEHQGWHDVLGTVRWYVDQLGARQVVPSRESAGSARGSTAYYYFEEAEATDFSGYGRSTSADTPSEITARDLGEENEYNLLAHLALITNVAANCVEARSGIRSIKLPLRSTDTKEIIGQDSTLEILFALASMPLSPEVRGAAFCSIASLISVQGIRNADMSELREAAVGAWKLVDSYQIVPTFILDQFPSSEDPLSALNATGISFPMSSTALVRNTLSSCILSVVLRLS